LAVYCVVTISVEKKSIGFVSV